MIANVDEAPIGLGVIEHDVAQRMRYKAYLGPLWEHLEDSRTTSIRVNADGKIFVSRFGLGKMLLPESMPEKKRAALIGYLANLENGRAMDRLHSRLQCDLPLFGSRVQAFAPPISEWTIILRNHSKIIVPYASYLDEAQPEAALADESWHGVPDRVMQGWGKALLQAIRLRKNITIAGSVDSGKSTFLNTLLEQHAGIYGDDRLVVVQDRREVIPTSFADHIVLMARVEQARSGLNGTTSRFMYEFADTVEDAMRCDGSTFAWAEVRDPESAIGLVSAANTGTRGIKETIHANSARDVPARFEDLITNAKRTPVKRQVAKLCEMIVYMQNYRLVDVQRCMGVDERGEYEFERVVA